ncbi:MAG: hypothetical protein L0312_26690 [Acidobacteria bacterium]|nr:hypothetical protein [Acidobacteriota bacterium]
MALVNITSVFGLIRQAAYLLACSRFGTNLTFLAYLSRFANMFLRQMLRDEEVWEVDGRQGHQIIESVKSYLDWRAGDTWRKRFDPTREYYVCGYRTLMQAWLAPEAEPIRKQMPIPFPAKPAYKPRRAA